MGCVNSLYRQTHYLHDGEFGGSFKFQYCPGETDCPSQDNSSKVMTTAQQKFYSLKTLIHIHSMIWDTSLVS